MGAFYLVLMEGKGKIASENESERKRLLESEVGSAGHLQKPHASISSISSRRAVMRAIYKFVAPAAACARATSLSIALCCQVNLGYKNGRRSNLLSSGE